jgi:hypothetical protein
LAGRPRFIGGKEYEKEKGYEVVFIIDLTRHMIPGNCALRMKTFSTNGEKSG